MSAMHNFDILSVHVPGDDMAADDISRLHDYGHLRNYMCNLGIRDSHACAQFMHDIPWHTSETTAFFIFQQVLNYHASKSILQRGEPHVNWD